MTDDPTRTRPTGAQPAHQAGSPREGAETSEITTPTPATVAEPHEARSRARWSTGQVLGLLVVLALLGAAVAGGLRYRRLEERVDDLEREVAELEERSDRGWWFPGGWMVPGRPDDHPQRPGGPFGQWYFDDHPEEMPFPNPWPDAGEERPGDEEREREEQREQERDESENQPSDQD